MCGIIYAYNQASESSHAIFSKILRFVKITLCSDQADFIQTSFLQMGTVEINFDDTDIISGIKITDHNQLTSLDNFF